MISPEDYGDRIAEVYDDWYDERMPSEDTAAFIFNLAPNGSFLELGVGTGRIAARLALRGAHVVGVDVSKKMLQKLKERDGGDLVDARHMDMTDAGTLGTFSVVYCVFSSLLALDSFEQQVDAFRVAQSTMSEDGIFVVEAHVPSHRSLADANTPKVARLGRDWALLEFSKVDERQQRLDIQLVELREPGRFCFFPASLRFMTHQEISVAAALANLSLERQLADWTGSSGPGDIYIFRKARKS